MSSIDRRATTKAVAVGALVALGLPILYLVGAVLIWNGIVDPDRMGDVKATINSLTLNATAGLALAVAGLAIIVKAAGLGTRAGLSLFLLGLPAIAMLWFLSYANLGGALGSPF